MTLSARMPDLAHLETLLAVARAGSQNAAAGELGVSPQAVAQRITALQSLTGLTLVRRTRRGSTLTPDGEVVVRWAGRVLDAATELDVGVAALRGEQRAVLRVAASLTVAEHLLPGWLVAATTARTAGTTGGTPGATGSPRTAPESTLHAVNSETVLRLVLDGAADLGFVESPGPVAGLRSRVVARDELVLVVAPAHPLAHHRGPVTPGELATTALVTREEGSGTRSAFESALRHALEGADVGPRPVLELASTAAVRAAVLAGAGPAVLSRLAVADDLATGRLVVVPTTGLDLRRTLRAVWRGGVAPSTAAARDLLAVASRRA